MKSNVLLDLNNESIVVGKTIFEARVNNGVPTDFILLFSSNKMCYYIMEAHKGDNGQIYFFYNNYIEISTIQGIHI